MHPAQPTLWNLLERLQRRLEREGLVGAQLDAAVADLLRGALRK